MDEPLIGDIIARVSEELLASQQARRADGRPAIFEVASLEIELNFTVTESKSGQGGLDLKVISVGGERKYDQQQVQRIVVHLAAAADSDDDGTDPFFDQATRVRPRRSFTADAATEDGRKVSPTDQDASTSDWSEVPQD